MSFMACSHDALAGTPWNQETTVFNQDALPHDPGTKALGLWSHSQFRQLAELSDEMLTIVGDVAPP